MKLASPVGRLIAAHWALPAVCALFALVGALVLEDYGSPLDTGEQRAIGNAALDYLAGDGERAFDRMHRPSDRYFGAAFEAPLVLLLERIIGLEDRRDILLGRHLLTHLLFLVGGVFCYLLVLRMFGSRTLALLAVALFLLHPRIYAHSFFNSKDVPFLVMFMVSLYLVHRAFRRDTLGSFLLCGVGVGLLVNLRIMGIVLFAAVLVLHALDLAFAGSAAERKRVLLTGGVFALAAMLTYHASLPVLWTDPVGRFPDLVRTLDEHPTEGFNLLRGEWLYSRDGPPFDYVPVWVGITTPPATLLLAAFGALALAWRALRRPRDVLRNGPLRFGLLLAALPVATAAAVVILESNVHGDWRHLYFLYAPLLLLAVVGLAAAGGAIPGRWARAGTYALAGAALAVTVVSMVRIHPLQNDYFSLLADRTTPERLNASYTMNYWRNSARSILGDILRDHPSGALFFSFGHTPGVRAFLPADDRERIVETRDFRSGDRNFYGVHEGDCSPSAPVAPIPPVSRIYAATLDCFVDPVAWFDHFRREALASGEPLVRSVYDVHRDGRILTYLRDSCPRNDVEGGGPRFFLHVIPVDAGDLPSWRREYGFGNLDFFLRRGLARIDGNCVALARLPDYPIAAIRTGQITDDGILWEADIAFGEEAPDYAIARREALAREPLARSVFDLHLAGRTLTYLRDGCTEAEADARFFLHVVPADEGDLPEHRREHGFDNLDFTLATRGARLDGNCVAVARLPDYPIATVRTGQYDDAGALWTAEFALPAGE